jgi:predicted aldo/keto reductase-like oxidoreductase
MALNSKLAFEAAQMAASSSGTNKGRREKSAGRKKAKPIEKHCGNAKIKKTEKMWENQGEENGKEGKAKIPAFCLPSISIGKCTDCHNSLQQKGVAKEINGNYEKFTQMIHWEGGENGSAGRRQKQCQFENSLK